MRFSASSPGSIVTPADTHLARPAGDATLAFAADQLAYYFALVTGGMPKVAGAGPSSTPSSQEQAEGPVLALRLEPSGTDLGGAEADASALEVAGDRGVLSSATSRGLLFGVYRLLERFAGACWTTRWEAEEMLPRLPAVDLPEGQYHWRPRFSVRAFTNYPRIDAETADFADWMAKGGFNQYLVNPQPPGAWEAYREHLRDEAALRGITATLDHHTLPFWLPPEELFADHPEYFALVGGERTPGGQPCTSNREVQDLVSRNILAFLDGNPEVREVGLWPRDGYGWCECEACRGEDPPRPSWWSPDLPSRTDTYLRFVNAVAERVGEARPDVGLTALAYVNYVDPPREVRPLPQVAVYFAAFQRCIKHPLSARDCRWRNPAYADMLQRWREATPGPLRMFLYDLQVDMLSLPCFSLERLADDFDFMQRAGVDGYVLEYVPEEWLTFAPVAHLVGSLSWREEPARGATSPREVLEPWMRRVYGRGGEEVGLAIEEVARRVLAEGPCTGHYDLTYAARATAALLRAALGHLGRALTVSSDDKHAWRNVRRLQASVGLLLRVAEWQRRLSDVKEAVPGKRQRLIHLAEKAAEEVVAWAEGHATEGVVKAQAVKDRVAREMERATKEGA